MKTVFVSGNFNVLHPGHQRILRFANELGDKLIVGVYSDKLAGGKAYIREGYRLEGVKNNIYVSEAFLLEEKIDVSYTSCFFRDFLCCISILRSRYFRST